MKLEGRHTFAAPRQMVWNAVMDPEVIAAVMPGCKALEAVGENAFQGAMTIKVGPVQGQFKGEVELSELVPPSSYRLKLKGKGAPGFVDGDGTLQLAEAEDGGTVLTYAIDAKVGGRIASVGQRLLDSSAKVISRQSLEGLEAQINARHAASQSGEPVAEAEAPEKPSDAAMAADFATGLAGELIPPRLRPVLAIAAVALAVLAILGLRSCGG